MVFGVLCNWGRFRTSLNASFDVFDSCFHLKTYWSINWIGLNWFWWLEMKLVFLEKRMELWFALCNYEFRMIRKDVCELRTWSYLDNEFLLKKGKWDEFSEFLEIIGIELWCWYVWTILMICDTWKYFVDVFEHECLVSVNYWEKDEFCENRRTLTKWGFMIG